MRPEIRILVRREGDNWVAVCLDYYLAAQGRDWTELFQAFVYTWNAHIAQSRKFGREPFTSLPKAPPEYAPLYEQGLTIWAHPLPTPPFSVQVAPEQPFAQPSPIWRWKAEPTTTAA